MTIEHQALALVEQRHKDEAAKAAGFDDWADANDLPQPVRLRRAILAHAQTLANLEKMRTDLAEIFDALRYAEGDDPKISAALAIAAPYPASDPVVEAIREMALTDATQDDAAALHKALASRGLEIVERRDR